MESVIISRMKYYTVLLLLLLFAAGDIAAREYYTYHMVKRGDTLWSISRRYKIPVTTLRRVNRLRGSGMRAGKKIRIPSNGKKHSPSPSARKTRWYRVRRGDTVWRLTRRFGISRARLCRLNGVRRLKLRPGQRLRVRGTPLRVVRKSRSVVKKRKRGGKSLSGSRWYRVRKGDSYWRIARKFRVGVSRLKRLNRGRRLYRGTRIRIPGGRSVRYARRSRKTRYKSTRRRKGRRRYRRRYRRRGPYFGSIPRPFRLRLRWPVRGRLVERFGVGRKWISNGITIKTGAGRRILAAGSGVIAFRGRKRGYGLMVIVRHSNNIYSVYTNMQGSGVRRGQRVRRGAVLGRTGRVKGLSCYGLHFELYYKTRPVNPVKYLS